MALIRSTLAASMRTEEPSGKLAAAREQAPVSRRSPPRTGSPVWALLWLPLPDFCSDRVPVKTTAVALPCARALSAK